MNTSTKPTLTPVLMVNFNGTLGYSIIIPFLVFLVDKFGGNEFIYGIMGLILGAWLYGIIGNVTFYMAAAMLFLIFLLSFRMIKMKPKLINQV